MLFRNQKGQSLIETCVGMISLILIIGVVFLGLRMRTIHQTVSHLAYEALICEETVQPFKNCVRDLEQKLKIILGTELRLEIHQSLTATERHLSLKIFLSQIPLLKSHTLTITESLPRELI